MDKLITELINNHELWLETRIIERNEFISQPGEIERYFYFVEDGALSDFSWQVDGQLVEADRSLILNNLSIISADIEVI